MFSLTDNPTPSVYPPHLKINKRMGRKFLNLAKNWIFFFFTVFCTEDFETSLSDYQKALSILEQLVEPDNRKIADLYPCF